MVPPYVPVPDTEFILGLHKVKRKNRTRRRWKDASGQIYEWDYQHGELEVYTSKGRHTGVLDPYGQLIKPAERGRKIDV